MTVNRLCLIAAFIAFLLGLLYVLFVATLDDTTQTWLGFLFGGFSLSALAAIL